MITLDNLFDFFAFAAENNTYIQHQPNTEGSTNRYSRYKTEGVTGELSNLGFPRLEVVQLPTGLLNYFGSSTRDEMSVRWRIIYNLSDIHDFADKTTKIDNAKAAAFQLLNYIRLAQINGSENTLLCAFDLNSVRYTLIDYQLNSGMAVGIEVTLAFRETVNWQTITYGDFPAYEGVIALPENNGSYVLNVQNGVYTWQPSSTLNYTPENVANKSTSVAADQSSNTKYPSVKAVYDWATGAFTTTAAVASQITAALTGYATQSWVTSQGYITNVVTALGFTPENVANKSTSVATDQASNTKYPSVKAVFDWVTGLGYLLASTAATTYQTIITASSWGAFINALTAKTVPADNDAITLMDSADSSNAKKITFANFRNALVGLSSELRRVYYFEDFLGRLDQTATFNNHFTAYLSLGGSSRISTVASASMFTDAYGVVQIETQTSAASSGFIGALDMGVRPGSGVIVFEQRVRIETLSDGTNRFDVYAGIGSRASYLATNTVAFRYSDDINSGRWQLYRNTSGVGTATLDSGITVNAGQWYKLRIEINAAGTQADFFIDGGFVGTLGSLPVAGLGALFAWRKTLGTTNRNIFIDYGYCEQTLTISR